jgi:hypothetical protein
LRLDDTLENQQNVGEIIQIGIVSGLAVADYHIGVEIHSVVPTLERVLSY